MKNGIDYFVALLLILCLVAFIYPYFSQHRFEEDIFTDTKTAIERIKEIEKEGHFYILTIEGWWNSDNAKFEEEVFLIDHTETAITAIRKNRRIVTVGDIHNLKTNIRSSHIEIEKKNEKVYTFEIDVNTDFEGLGKKTAKHPIEHVIHTAISGTLHLKELSELSAVEERKLNHELRQEFFYCKKIELRGKNLHVEFLSTKYLDELEKIYNGDVEGEIIVYVRY